MGQIIHQTITANVNASFYVAASESQVMYTVLVMFDEEVIEYATAFIDEIARDTIDLAHDGEASVPLDKYEDEVEDVLFERIKFWKCVDDSVRQHGTFMPIKVFRHSAQSFYAKTRGGVDGNSQTRSVLKCSSSSHKWEQKVVTHTFNTILVNAFVAWRMLMKEDLLTTRESFGDIHKYRQKLNRVQCMADFALDTALELLEHADELARNENASSDADENGQNGITLQEKQRLIRRAKKRKKKRILFFNEGDGLRLRLKIPNHPHVIGEHDIYCALCGQNMSKSFRGHRTNHKCGYCDVHLCIKLRTGFRKSCWEMWHTTKKLRPRAPIAIVGDARNGSEDEAQDSEELPELDTKDEQNVNARSTSPSVARQVAVVISEPAEDQEEEEDIDGSTHPAGRSSRKRQRSLSIDSSVDRNNDR